MSLSYPKLTGLYSPWVVDEMVQVLSLADGLGEDIVDISVPDFLRDFHGYGLGWAGILGLDGKFTVPAFKRLIGSLVDLRDPIDNRPVIQTIYGKRVELVIPDIPVGEQVHPVAFGTMTDHGHELAGVKVQIFPDDEKSSHNAVPLSSFSICAFNQSTSATEAPGGHRSSMLAMVSFQV